MESVIDPHYGKMDLPEAGLLERRANRVREHGRPKHPADLDFEVSYSQSIVK